jgi:hypothetical protein
MLDWSYSIPRVAVRYVETSLSTEWKEKVHVIGRTYRLKTPTLAVMTLDGQKIPVTIPMGATVEVIATDINGNRLVDVTWEGHTVMMFTTDLRERGKVVTARVVSA